MFFFFLEARSLALDFAQVGEAFTGVTGEFYPAFSTTNALYRLQVNFGRSAFGWKPPVAVAVGEPQVWDSGHVVARVTACVDADRTRKQVAADWKRGASRE